MSQKYREEHICTVGTAAMGKNVFDMERLYCDIFKI